MVLGQEEPDSRSQEEDPEVEEHPELEADGDELAAGDPPEEGGLFIGEDVGRPEPADGRHHVGIHLTSHGASRAGRQSKNCGQGA
jgi:hypothetical protein